MDVMTFFFVFTCFWAEKLMDICGRDDPFFGLHLFLGRKLDICGHIMTLKKPVLLLRSKNMVILRYTKPSYEYLL